MVDKREQVLARVFETLGTIPNVTTYVRNRDNLPDDKLPAVYMLDADETAREQAFNRGRPTSSPNLVDLNPEIYIAVKNARPDNKNVGQDLNAYRLAILTALYQDATLVGLLGGNGEIQYKGCVTDLARGREMNGIMGLDIAFVYELKPSEF